MTDACQLIVFREGGAPTPTGLPTIVCLDACETVPPVATVPRGAQYLVCQRRASHGAASHPPMARLISARRGTVYCTVEPQPDHVRLLSRVWGQSTRARLIKQCPPQDAWLCVSAQGRAIEYAIKVQRYRHIHTAGVQLAKELDTCEKVARENGRLAWLRKQYGAQILKQPHEAASDLNALH